MFDANSNTNIVWGASVDTSPNNLSQSPVNIRIAKRRMHDYLFCLRHQERPWRRYNRHNTKVNPQVHCWDDDREVLVTQYFLFEISVVSVSNFLLPVASLSNCHWILCRITLCVTRG